MYKVVFKDPVYQRFGNKTTCKLKAYIQDSESKTIIKHLTRSGFTFKSDNDIEDSKLGRAIALSRAKISIYSAVRDLMKEDLNIKNTLDACICIGYMTKFLLHERNHIHWLLDEEDEWDTHFDIESYILDYIGSVLPPLRY